MGDIFLSGQNQCHITGVKKSYFCHTFHLRPKKVFWWWRVAGGRWRWWVKSDFSVSLCLFLNFQTQRNQTPFQQTDTKWAQSLTIFWDTQYIKNQGNLNFTYLRQIGLKLQMLTHDKKDGMSSNFFQDKNITQIN